MLLGAAIESADHGTDRAVGDSHIRASGQMVGDNRDKAVDMGVLAVARRPPMLYSEFFPFQSSWWPLRKLVFPWQTPV